MTPATNSSEFRPEDRPNRSETPRRSVALDVAGGDLMLRGQFTDWESGLTFGPDLDRVGVRLAVDATSATAVSSEDAPRLFSFRSRSVEAVGAGAYRADGVLNGARGPMPLQVTIETPPGHTALFVLSFAAERGDFGDGWGDLIRNVDAFQDEEGEPVRLAHAWLTAPVLAAA